MWIPNMGIHTNHKNFWFILKSNTNRRVAIFGSTLHTVMDQFCYMFGWITFYKWCTHFVSPFTSFLLMLGDSSSESVLVLIFYLRFACLNKLNNLYYLLET